MKNYQGTEVLTLRVWNVCVVVYLLFYENLKTIYFKDVGILKIVLRQIT